MRPFRKYLALASTATFLITPMTSAFAQTGPYYGPWKSMPEVTSCEGAALTSYASCLWTANARRDSATYLATDNDKAMSPAFWFKRLPEQRFSWDGPILMLSHRGLVDLSQGITENTIASVVNAMYHGLYMIEIDVQASKPDPGKTTGVAIALHDATLNRVAGIPIVTDPSKPGNPTVTSSLVYVKDKFASELQGQPSYVKNPRFGTQFATSADIQFRPAAPRNLYTAAINTNIQTAENLFKSVSGLSTSNTSINIDALRSPVNGHLIDGTGVTFIWDPKSLESAKAVARMVIDYPTDELANRSMMKTYAEQWLPAGTPRSGVAQAAALWWAEAKTDTERAKLRLLKIVPVVNVRQELESKVSETPAGDAAAYARSYVESWSANSPIPYVEFPGTWTPNWWVFVESRLSGMGYMLSWNFPYNEKIKGTKFTHSPLISVGYRYDDFGYRKATSEISSSQTYKYTPYVWDMDGRPKEDTVSPYRRTACAQVQFYLKSDPYERPPFFWPTRVTQARITAHKEIHQGALAKLVTTDVPLEEAFCLEHKIYNSPSDPSGGLLSGHQQQQITEVTNQTTVYSKEQSRPYQDKTNPTAPPPVIF